MLSFQESKQEIIAAFESISLHILFPRTLIESIKRNGFRNALKYIESYNKSILKSRELVDKIRSLQEWGLLWDSEFSWKMALIRVCAEFKSSQEAIIDCGEASDPFEILFYKQHNIDKNCLRAFTQIVFGPDGKLHLSNSINEIIIINPSKIPHLLPKFSKSTQEYYNLELHPLDSEELDKLNVN